MKLSVRIMFVFALLYGGWVSAACNSQVTMTKPDRVYVIRGDGTVSDEYGLMWQQCSLGLTGASCNAGAALTLTWQAALAAANVNADYGYDDWRLPNKNELASLPEDACYSPAINETVFPNTPSELFWSSSPYAGINSNAWGVNFNYGGVYSNLKNYSRYVRLVRGSQ